MGDWLPQKERKGCPLHLDLGEGERQVGDERGKWGMREEAQQGLIS
jgi:hypothetical protein